MVKLREYSGGLVDKALNQPCSVGALPVDLKANENTSWSGVVNGNLADKMPTKEVSLVNGSCNKVPSEESLFVNGSCNKVPSEESLFVNGSCTKVSTNEITSVNGYSDKISAKVTSTNRSSINKVVKDVSVPKVNGNCEAEIRKIPMVNGNNKNNGCSVNGSKAPSESGSYSIVPTSNSLCNDLPDENQHGFIEVVNKKKRNKRNNRNYRKQPISNLPPGLNSENIRGDSRNDKNHKKSSLTSLSIPSRNFAAVRSSEKSYSSVLVHGQNKNGSPNASSSAQNVVKCTESNEHFNATKLSELTISVNHLSKDSTGSVKDLSTVSCKQKSLLAKVEMNDVSAQTELSVAVEESLCSKVCLPSQEEVIHASEKHFPNDYVDGEISDDSSTRAYCDSVVSNDSGRGDSEITYDELMPYCCEFPREKTSQLIGRGGSFKNTIERKSGVKFWVYPHDYDRNLSIICMMGTGAHIERAKELIKERFRHVTLKQWIGFNPINPPLSEKYLPILPEGIDFMGVVSCICDPNFFWVQQYGHPHLYSLEDLERRISNHFNTVPDAPGIDNPTIGSVIAVPGARDGDNVKWIRGWVINVIPEDGNVVVRYLDHGGDHLVPVSNIRPMRHDFFSMPFFAAQCCLNDILPAGGVWSDEARAEFTRLCNSSTCPPIVRVMYKTPECYYVAMLGYDSEINAQVDIATHLVTKGFGLRPCFPATEFSSDLHQ